MRDADDTTAAEERSQVRREWAGVALLACITLLLGFAFPYAEATRNANERPRLIQGMALVEAGSWAIDGPGAKRLLPGPDIARSPVDGRLYPNKPPGATLTAAPAYLLARAHARLRGAPLTLRRYTWWARVVGGLAPTVLLCWALWWGLSRRRDGARRGGAALASVAVALVVYALGTPANAYAHLLYGHQLAACLLWVGVFVVLDGLRRGSAPWSAIGGALAGASVGVEYAAAFAGLPLAATVAWMFVRGGRHVRIAAVAAALGAVFPVLLLGWYHARVFGSPMATGYHHVINPEFAALHGQGLLGLGRPTWSAFYTHILSPASGLLWWAPAVVPAIAGLILRARDDDDTRERLFARVALAIVGVYVLTTASLNFTGGWRVGPRYLVVILPVIVPGWVWLVEALRRRCQRLFTRAVVDGVGVALVTWSLALNGLAGSLWPHIDLTNVNQPVSEVLLPLWFKGHAPYSLCGALGVPGATLPALAALTAAVALAALGLSALARRLSGLTLALGVITGLALVGATPRVFTPHPRADANLRYIERVWEPPRWGGAARSRVLAPAQ